MLGHLAPGQPPVGRDVVEPGDAGLGDVQQGAHDVVLLDELQERVEAEDGRAHRPRQVPADRRGQVLAEDVGEAEHGDLVPGLSSAKSRMRPSASTRARSTLFLTGLVRGVSSWKVFGSLAAEP